MSHDLLEHSGFESDASSANGDPSCFAEITNSKDERRNKGERNKYSRVSNKSNTKVVTDALSTRNLSEKRSRRKRSTPSVYSAESINYHGFNIYQASLHGSLPLCVLLWGMASAKRVNLVVPDSSGNNPLHHAALAESSEVYPLVNSFFLLLIDCCS